MSKYYATYKCQMCGAVIKYGEPTEIPVYALPQLIAKVIQQNQIFAGNPYLHQAQMYLPHICKDGSGGLAVFVGFRLENCP